VFQPTVSTVPPHTNRKTAKGRSFGFKFNNKKKDEKEKKVHQI